MVLAQKLVYPVKENDKHALRNWVWPVERSYTPYGFWVMHDEPEEEERRRTKKDNKIEIFKFTSLNFWVG